MTIMTILVYHHLDIIISLISYRLKQNTNQMKENSENVRTLHELLDYNAQKFTSAEVLLQKNLKKWSKMAHSIKLKTVIQKYIDIISEQLQKLEGFFEHEHITAISVSNSVMSSMINETEEKLRICTDFKVKDACLLSSIQSINHYKISTYGTAAAFANTLGMEDQAAIFHQAEVKEKQIDVRLSQLAEHEINLTAMAPLLLT
jgi:ferritin-like metal-binding protein YciE